MFKIRLLISLSMASLIVLPVSYAQDFESWKHQQQKQFVQSKHSFETYKDELQQAFSDYNRKTSAIWGNDNVNPDKAVWVSYFDKLNNRSVVNLEQGTIDVEIAIPESTRLADDLAHKRLRQALINAMTHGVDNRPMTAIAKHPVSLPRGPAVLEGQIGDDHGKPLNSNNYKKQADTAANKVVKKKIKGNDGVTRIVYKAQLKLVPDHIRVRAARYQPLVQRYAHEQSVPEPLVFAVMEVESYFNPTARSSAPAFGLMQLVPTSGARDAYRYLYNKDRVVSDSYLYDPENNVRLGTAYLNQLHYKYLNGVESDASRMLCAIAAYNGGASNVFKSFIGAYSSDKYGSYSRYKRAALKEINKRTTRQVYNRIHQHHPSQETRGYIKKVTERMPKYRA